MKEPEVHSMKTARSVLIAGLFSLCFSTALIAKEPPDLLLLAGEENPPYIDTSRPENGIYAHIVQTAFLRSGYQSKIVTKNWARAMKSTEDATFDAIVAAWYFEDRNKTFLFSTPYAVNRVSFIKLKTKKIEWRTLEDLRFFKFALVRSSFISQKFNNVRNLKRFFVGDDLNVIRMVLRGRVDLGALEEIAADYILDKHFKQERDQLDFVTKPAAINKTHVIISRKHPEGPKLIEAFNHGLTQMIQDGSYQKIFENSGFEKLMHTELPQ